jgi:hypothetical protein
MGRRFDTVTLLTDYGYTDEFAGVLHSVVRDLAPHVALVDLTHGIAPFDVRAGALALARAIPYVAEGVVLAVVDPGVGTSRRAVAIEVADGAGVLVGPDNGGHRRGQPRRCPRQPRLPPRNGRRHVRRARRVRSGGGPPVPGRRP